MRYKKWPEGDYVPGIRVAFEDRPVTDVLSREYCVVIRLPKLSEVRTTSGLHADIYITVI